MSLSPQSLRDSAWGLLGPWEGLLQPPVCWLQLAEPQVSPGHRRSSWGDKLLCGLLD